RFEAVLADRAALARRVAGPKARDAGNQGNPGQAHLQTRGPEHGPGHGPRVSPRSRGRVIDLAATGAGKREQGHGFWQSAAIAPPSSTDRRGHPSALWRGKHSACRVFVSVTTPAVGARQHFTGIWTRGTGR